MRAPPRDITTLFEKNGKRVEEIIKLLQMPDSIVIEVVDSSDEEVICCGVYQTSENSHESKKAEITKSSKYHVDKKNMNHSMLFEEFDVDIIEDLQFLDKPSIVNKDRQTSCSNTTPSTKAQQQQQRKHISSSDSIPGSRSSHALPNTSQKSSDSSIKKKVSSTTPRVIIPAKVTMNKPRVSIDKAAELFRAGRSRKGSAHFGRAGGSVPPPPPSSSSSSSSSSSFTSTSTKTTPSPSSSSAQHMDEPGLKRKSPSSPRKKYHMESCVYCKKKARRLCTTCNCCSSHCPCGLGMPICNCPACNHRCFVSQLQEDNASFHKKRAKEQETLLGEAKDNFHRSSHRRRYSGSPNSQSYNQPNYPANDPSHAPLSQHPHWQSSDPYKCLHVPQNSSFEVCKKQYRRLCLKYHPDKSKLPHATEAFVAITDAFRDISRRYSKD